MIRNNVIAFNGKYGVESDSDCPTGPVLVDRNVIFGNRGGSVESGCRHVTVTGGNILRDPRFVPGGRNFQLRAGSPAIDRARGDYAPRVDIRGRRRPSGRGYDVGAFERRAGAQQHAPAGRGRRRPTAAPARSAAARGPRGVSSTGSSADRPGRSQATAWGRRPGALGALDGGVGSGAVRRPSGGPRPASEPPAARQARAGAARRRAGRRERERRRARQPERARRAAGLGGLQATSSSGATAGAACGRSFGSASVIPTMIQNIRAVSALRKTMMTDQVQSPISSACATRPMKSEPTAQRPVGVRRSDPGRDEQAEESAPVNPSSAAVPMYVLCATKLSPPRRSCCTSRSTPGVWNQLLGDVRERPHPTPSTGFSNAVLAAAFQRFVRPAPDFSSFVFGA